MEETMIEKKTSLAQKNFEAYVKSHDVQYVAEDAVFTHMNTGEKTIGRKAIGEMLHYIYHVAFDAKADVKNLVVTGNKALIEGNFMGKHIGEFAGIQATNKEVNVPICVTYELEDGFIKQGRVYMLMDVMIKQLTS